MTSPLQRPVAMMEWMEKERKERRKKERKKQPKLISRSSGWHHTCKEGKRETENEEEIQIVLVY